MARRNTRFRPTGMAGNLIMQVLIRIKIGDGFTKFTFIIYIYEHDVVLLRNELTITRSSTSMRFSTNSISKELMIIKDALQVCMCVRTCVFEDLGLDMVLKFLIAVKNTL